MNQLLFEGRSLVGIVSSIIRQDDLRVVHSRLDWERMFRLADFHKVANIVYLGVLGHGDALPDRWREHFFQRYQESLLFGENCKEMTKEILTWLDMREISCVVLTYEYVRDFYKLPEMAANSPVQILLDDENYTLAKGYLIDLGYETDQIYKGWGERLKKVPGVSVILYHTLPFRTAKYQKGMTKLLESSCLKEPYDYIRMFPAESEFIFRMAVAAYHYVEDALTIREVMDLLLCHIQWRDDLNMEAVQKKLAEFQVDELSNKILRIAYMWFGDKKDSYFTNQPEDMAVYDVLEDRLLTKGIINHESDTQAIRLQNLIQKEINKEQRQESRELWKEKLARRFSKVTKKLRWMFPDFHYMSSIYPSVEKLPVLLPVFWILRDIRLLFRMFLRP
ncbi:MAG: nucleotidyltransferase family protein [Lachnospiraceae bacterium]|jgi:hypothetical protein|nr:nucleotidyltransferase family protein [Lachnospiraceae bacterium]